MHFFENNIYINCKFYKIFYYVSLCKKIIQFIYHLINIFKYFIKKKYLFINYRNEFYFYDMHL